MLFLLRIGEDVVGAFLDPRLVLQGVHLLQIDDVPLGAGLRGSPSCSEVDTDPGNLHADIDTSFTDFRLYCLLDTKF